MKLLFPAFFGSSRGNTSFFHIFGSSHVNTSFFHIFGSSHEGFHIGSSHGNVIFPHEGPKAFLDLLANNHQ